MLAEKNWYLIQVKEKGEKRVIESLGRKKIETFLPLNKLKGQHESRKHSPVYQSLFPQHLFVHIAAPEINIVKSTEGVLHFLYWLCDYAIISKSDVEAIRVFLDVYYDVWLEKANISAVHNPVIESYANFDIDSYKEINQAEKIFLPTLGYFLLAKPETVKEFLHHAI